MIMLERSTSIVFSHHSLPSLKKLILHDWEKYYTRLDWCLITWPNWQKSWQQQMQWNSCFISVGVLTVLRILASLKNLEQYNKSPSGKFVKKKKKLLQNILQQAKFFRITMFSGWFRWFLRIINRCQCFFTLNVLFDEVGRRLEHEKKFFC